jgi:prevent-host-death family protein
MNLSISKDIEPLSKFRKKSADFIERLKNDKQPIVLTQHGKSAAVLMDVSEYERFSKKLELLEDLLEAKQQVQQGDTYSMEEAENRIANHLAYQVAITS